MAAFTDEAIKLLLNVNTLVVSAVVENVEYASVIPNFFCIKRKIRELHILKFRSRSWCVHTFPCASRVRSFLLIALFPGIWTLSILLSFHMRTFDFWILSGLHKSPCASKITLSFTVSGLTGYPKFCEGFSLALHGLCKTKLSGLAFAGTVGCGFAIGEPSLELACWPLCDMALCFPIESERHLLKWLRENIEKFIMLNKRRKWFQSSREKLSSVCMSASWFLVSTYLILIIGSKLILSNNQSRATLWILDTCLTVGLRPLMIIFIAASLSTNTYNIGAFGTLL